MRSTGRVFLNVATAGLVVAALLVGCKTKGTAKAARPKPALPSREAYEIATEGYIFAYPLVLMDMTRRMMTNVRDPEGMRAPMGQLARQRSLPLALNHDATVPNADMLYTGVWLDVSREPWVLSLPDMKDRYSLFLMLDGWSTAFEALGKRTTGAGPQKCAIIGPGWKGKLPSGVEAFRSPTSMVWVLGRIYCAGTPEDYVAVHALQDQCSAVPLSAYGKPYTPPPGQVDPAIDRQKTANEQVNALGVTAFFNQFALLMKDNPPDHADAPVLKKMARLGITPGRPFDIGRLDSAVIQVLEYVPNAAVGKLMDWPKESAKTHEWNSQDGWRWTVKTGTYDTDYTQRALVAAIGLGAARPQDLVTAASTADEAGQLYSGNFRYKMHFAPGQAPSANGFWSLTMYDSDYFLVSNPLSRYTLSARDQFKFNFDGSLDLYLQRHPPGADREANWLPAPEGNFMLMLRFYWPKDSVIKGSWKIPPVKKTD